MPLPFAKWNLLWPGASRTGLSLLPFVSHVGLQQGRCARVLRWDCLSGLVPPSVVGGL